MKGAILWFTGLSGAGKTTISRLVAERLRRQGYRAEVLDGDLVREHLSKGLGFSREDRDTNVRRIGLVARLLARNGVVALVAAISPYRDAREEARRDTLADKAHFVEVYVKCDLATLAARDVKGLYKKAADGSLPNFTGVSDPYEEPADPDLTLRTDAGTPDERAAEVMEFIARRRLLADAAREADVRYPDY
ncbi:MAG: adenylyl-sulfate kinase [Planctomycetes bacterium]|nr:adenylyl-sulfate kinase [Planctomycetota bacterium]